MTSYTDTISKPSFLAQEKIKEKEIFLNGEVNMLQTKSRMPVADGSNMIRKTSLCLKGIMVDS